MAKAMKCCAIHVFILTSYLISKALKPSSHALVLHASFAQNMNWSKTSNRKLYNIHNQAGFRYTLDTLRSFAHIDLNMDILQSFLKDVVAWHLRHTACGWGYTLLHLKWKTKSRER